MAEVKKRVLGDLSGKLGPVVCSMRYDKQMVSKLPSEYPTRSERVKAHRRKFSSVNYFAKTVYRTDLLQDLWRASADNKMAAFNKVITLNSRHFKDNHPTVKNVITPEDLACPISQIRFSADRLKVSVLYEIGGTIIVFIVPFNAEQEQLPNFEILTPYKMEVPGPEFEIPLKIEDISKINEYPEYIIFATVIAENWTTTFAVEGKT